jgi:hypothetical protein
MLDRGKQHKTCDSVNQAFTPRNNPFINHKFVIKEIVFFEAVIMNDLHYHTFYAVCPYLYLSGNKNLNVN